MNKPSSLSIRSYQVGFGDCYLLSFKYPTSTGEPDKHVLIDCGSTGTPANAAGTIKDVVAEIERDCGKKLSAIVATHRHKDHISGFATAANGKGPGDTLRRLKPDLVVQPWTENPETARDAKSPSLRVKGIGKAVGEARFVASLGGMHSYAALVLDEVKRLGPSLPLGIRQQLEFLGEENLANLSAVKNLMSMGKKSEYLHYGMPTGLEKLLPGVKVHVLGPPTPKDYPKIEQQRSEDSDEFWHILGATARSSLTGTGMAPFHARFAAKSHPAHARWFAQRVKAAHAEQRLEIVRSLDEAMNNTSLILLFEAGGKKFLFPGDAQIENWNYALKDGPDAAANKKLLADTDFYKVGHHGSLNATPKTLWKLFKKKGDSTKKDRLFTAVSTMAGKHGKSSRQTEVPRRTLVTALEENSVFFTTQRLTKSKGLTEIMKFDL